MKTWMLFPALAAVFFAASSASAQDWALPRLNKSPRHLELIPLKHDDRELKGFIGYPAAKDKVPAVLVIHEIFGLSDWAKDAVDEFAEAGYIALAPDLLWGKGPGGAGTEALGSSNAVRTAISSLPADQVTADLKAAVAYLLKDPSCNGQVFVVGYCWGGGQSFRFATNSKDVKAAFVFYGIPLPPAEALATINCPVYGFFGEMDNRVTAAVPAEAELMKAAKKTFEPVTYAGAGHGFMRTGDGDPAGSAADKQARADSWKRMMDLMKTLSVPAKAPVAAPGPSPAPPM
jgi:carboxymethylenebutenolidase